jgi:tetratricopeptide (TPR) repeat protein
MNNLAISYLRSGRSDEALKLREEVLELRDKAGGPEHPETIGAMASLANSFFGAGREDEAIALQEQALAIGRRVLRPDHPYLAEATKQMAYFYERTGKMPEAEAALKEPAILKGKAGDTPQSPDPAPKEPPPKETAPVPAVRDIKALEKALEDLRQSKDAKPADKISAMTELVAAYGADDSGRKASKLGEEALALALRVLPAGDVRTRNAMEVLLTIYTTLGFDERVAELEKQLQALPPSVPEPK